MAVQFILGRSGTGKTSYCIKAIVDALLEAGDGQPLILLVPEQATYQAERAILSDKTVAGYHRLHVLSFARLQFLLSGKNTAKPAVTRIGQQMIIQRILRDNKSKLKVFGSSAGFPGLGRQMAETIAELHEYAKTPEDIEQLLGQLQKDERNSLAALKFADIDLVLREYLKFIEGKFINPDIQLTRSCRAVATSVLTKGAELWVDGFAGFTTSELAILTELLKAAAEAQIALCIDPANIDLANPDMASLEPTSMFSPTERTYAELIERIKKNKLRLARPIILKDGVRFSGSRELAHIEHDIFKLKPSKIPAANSVRIVSAPNARAEVQFVAREILRILKEKDYRYRDIAVIASDINRYEHYIRACFDDYGIPFFIDKRKSLNQHPAIGLICSALQAALNGFSNSDIFGFLKTDLAPIERSEVDLLENYCLAFGVAGSDWTGGQEWHFAGEDSEHFDEERVNRIRKKVGGPLLELRDKLCPVENPAKTMSAEEFTKAIFDFIDGLGVPETIGGWVEEADEHRQFYDKLLDIFDEFAEVFGGQEETAGDYLAIISSAISQMTLAFIPPTLDQVLVGSIERSRHPDLKAVFLIGATQREFPVPMRFESILTDEDREAAEKVKFELAATTGQKLAERQYLAYIAFTRPRELLCVTYPATDEGGSATTRSQFVDNLGMLFENLKEESIAGYKNDVEGVHSKSELADLLCSRLGKDGYRDSWLPSTPLGTGVTRDSIGASHEQIGSLLDGICLDEELAELGTEVLSAIDYDNRAELDAGIVEELFDGKRMLVRSSATRLSTFAACPYQYFARYILELEEREEFKFEPLDVGIFYHRVLDALLKRLNSVKKDFATVADEELLRLLREQITKFAERDLFISNFLRRSAHNGFIIHLAGEVLEDCVRAIAEMVRAGSFRPRWSEVSFGEVKDSTINIGEYKIKLSGGRVTALDGKIDRLDVAEAGGEKNAIIFDYKRKGKTFSWSEFYHGLDMQLPIYMLAVKNTNNPNFSIHNALGAFYMPVEVSPTKSTIDELSEKTESFNYKAKGMFDGRVFQQLDNTAGAGWSRYYSFRVTSKDGPYGNYSISAALKPDDFEGVLKFTEKKVIHLSEEILSGRIEVKPYRLNQKSPCSYCKYKAVCRFDWQVNEYNFLESVDKVGALEKMKGNNG